MLTFGPNCILTAVSHSRKLFIQEDKRWDYWQKFLSGACREFFFLIWTVFLALLRLGTTNLEKSLLFIVLKSVLVEQFILSAN